MAVNHTLPKIKTNFGQSLAKNSNRPSIVDMMKKAKEKNLSFSKLVMRINRDDDNRSECAFCFDGEKGEKHFYPFSVGQRNNLSDFSKVSVAARSFGIKIDPMQLSSLKNGQYHFSKDNSKQTRIKEDLGKPIFLSVGGYHINISPIPCEEPEMIDMDFDDEDELNTDFPPIDFLGV